MKKIYFKTIKRQNRDTLYSFLSRCIDKTENHKYKSYGRFPNSYSNEECTKGEHASTSFRSFDAIVQISKSYFKVSDKQVAKAIKKILTKNRGVPDKELGFLFCGTANRWVMHQNSGYCWFLNNEFVLNYSSSVNKKNYKGSGTYCMNDIISLMNS
jgi:hypothetical protein